MFIKSGKHLNMAEVYKPNIYLPSDVGSDTRTKEKSFIAKGATGEVIDFEQVRKCLHAIMPYFDTPIGQLQGDVLLNFNKMVAFVETLYDTTYYSKMYDMVVKTLQCENHPTVVAGTVGSYFCSRLNKTSAEGCCSLACSNSAPSPHESRCKYSIYSSKYSHVNGFNYKQEHVSETGLAQSIIYVPFATKDSFPGFSKREKDALKKAGVNYIRVVGLVDAESGEDNYVAITENFVAVENIKCRKEVIHPHSEASNSSNTCWIVVLIILILILIFIGLWLLNRYFQKRKMQKLM